MWQLKMWQLKMRQLKVSRGGRHADEHMSRRCPTGGHSQMPACHIRPPSEPVSQVSTVVTTGITRAGFVSAY